MDKGRYVPRFPKEIAALDKREVRLEGFMMPLGMGVQQKHFLLTSAAPTCGFCMPSGAEQIVEIQARTPVKYVLDPVVLSGRFVLVHDGDGGLLYGLPTRPRSRRSDAGRDRAYSSKGGKSK